MLPVSLSLAFGRSGAEPPYLNIRGGDLSLLFGIHNFGIIDNRLSVSREEVVCESSYCCRDVANGEDI